MKRLLRALLAAAGLAALAFPAAFAQAAWPQRPVRIIVPAPAGTGPDIMARLYAEHLGRALGQPFTVENRAGASGNIGGEAVAKAAPDGLTLFYAYNQIPTMNPHLFSKLSYDPVRDLVPVAQTLSTAYVLLGNNDLGAKDLAGVLALARKSPGKIAYASYGPGTASHLVFELIQDATGTQMLHVPYKQGQVTDVIGGQVAMVFEPFPSGIPFARSGKVRALAVTSDKRIAELPDAPAMNEAVPGLNLLGWQGVWVPAATPREIVAKLNAEINRITRLPDMQKRIADLGSQPMTMTPQDMAEQIQRESAQWGKVIRARHITLD